jgi:hypothetical protein
MAAEVNLPPNLSSHSTPPCSPGMNATLLPNVHLTKANPAIQYGGDIVIVVNTDDFMLA